MNNQIVPTCYEELCADPDQNPLGNGAAMITAVRNQYLPWAVDRPVAPLKDELLLDVGITMTGVIGVMAQADAHAGGTLQALHSLWKHGSRDTHRGKIFASLGDVHEIDIDVVEFDDQLLNLTEEVIVAGSVARHQQLLLANPDLELVPSNATEVPLSRRIRTRNSVFIPFPLVPYMLEKDLTARQAFEILIPVIQSLGLEAACGPLIDFLIIASTSKHGVTEGDTETVTEQPSVGITPARLRPVLQERRRILLFVHLPGLKPIFGGAPSDPALVGIMNSVRDMTNASLAERNDRQVDREQTKAPKTILERWPDHVDRLCKLCSVPA